MNTTSTSAIPNNPDPTPQPGPAPARRRIARRMAAGAVASLLIVLAAATFGQRPAEASEFYSNPTLSVLNSCENGEYHYAIGLYNFEANDSTEFTVTVTIGSGATETSVHDIAGGGLEWLDYTVPEGEMGSFHVTNDDDPTIDWLAEPTADCLADTQTEVSMVCPDDGGSATVLYEWVNTSYASATFTLHLPDASTQQNTIAWSDGPKTLEVPVEEGSQANASIDVDGVESSSISQAVDCLDDPTPTTSTTLPTPPTTVPDKPTSTTSTTSTPPGTPTSTTVPPIVLHVNELYPGSAIPVLLAADANLDQAVHVPTVRTAGASKLAFTGAQTGMMVLVGIGLVAAGAVCWIFNRRLKAAPGSID